MVPHSIGCKIDENLTSYKVINREQFTKILQIMHILYENINFGKGGSLLVLLSYILNIDNRK